MANNEDIPPLPTLATEEEFRLMFEVACVGMAQADPHTGILLRVNQQIAKFLGYNVSELLGRRFQDFTHPDDINRNWRIFQESASGSNPERHFEKRFIRKDGQVVWANVHMTMLRAADGTSLRSLAAIEDITERRRSEEVQRETDLRLRMLGDNLPDSYLCEYRREPDGSLRFLYLSAGVEKLHGIKPDALLENPSLISQQIEPELLSRMRLSEEACQREMRDYSMEFQIKRGDESQRWLLVRSRPRRLKDDLVVWDAVVTDITERRNLEAQFLRTQRLEAIGSLASGIAHDLNNILAPMLMVTGILRGLSLEQRDFDLVCMLEKSARRGADVIRQVLTFSKGIQGERIRLQAQHLVKEMVGIAKETFPRNINVQSNVDPRLWAIVGDSTQLHQVLMNLCVNARDAMPSGGELKLTAVNHHNPSLRTDCSPELEPGDYVMISVSDTGTGIAPELMHRIFEPFFSTKEPGKGTGLGLSTVLGIVKSHRGSLHVRSRPGKGTCFSLFIPVAERATEAETPIERAKSALGGGETVLLVDDENPILLVARQCLERSGYRVLTANNGHEALVTYISHQSEIRLILTDVMMPVMDGLALARCIRAYDLSIPIVAMSGLIPEEKSGEANSGIVNEFVEKPFVSEVLLNAVARQLRCRVPAMPAAR